MAGDDAEAGGATTGGGTDGTPAEGTPGARNRDYDWEDLAPAVREYDVGATVGDYSWVDYLEEYGDDDAADRVRQRRERARHELAAADAGRRETVEPPYPEWDELGADPPEPKWDAVEADPSGDLGFDPDEKGDVLATAARRAHNFHDYFD
jgi:flagellar protein FlaI